MNSDINEEVLNHLRFNFELKKKFYKYIDALTSANLIKTNIKFLKSCKSDCVIPLSYIPKFVFVDKYDPFPHIYSEILKAQIEGLNHQLKNKFRFVSQKFYDFQQCFYGTCNNLNLFSKHIDYAHNINRRKVNLRKTHHIEKLDNLFINSKWTTHSDPKVIINLSNYNLTKTESTLLGYGLSFSIDNPDPWMPLLKNFKYWKNKNINQEINPDILYGILLKLTADRQNNIKFPNRFYQALHNLHQNKDITISRSDKGNNIVIQNTIAYQNKSYALLNDINTYTKLNTNPLKNSQHNFNKSLTQLLPTHKHLISKFKSYLPTISQFYAIPKIHKPNIPLRPIISNINCITFNLSKWLANELKPLIGTISTSHIINTEHFLQKIRPYQLSNYNIVSFDVTSLFTNVPIDYTLMLLEQYIIQHNIKFTIPFDIIKKLVNLTLDHAYFQFENNYFKQNSGLSMGSPLSPIFSNIFMELIEVHFILPNPICQQMIWLRYVDDIFAIIPKENNTTQIFNFINNIHPKIKFTIETPIDNKIPFLDILITWTTHTHYTHIYRKPTSNPAYIHWYSTHEISTKKAVLSNLFLRAHRFCDPPYLEEEINYIINIFKKLQYPYPIIKHALKKAKIKYLNLTHPKDITFNNLLPIPNLSTKETTNYIPNTIHTIKSNTLTLKYTLKPKNNISEQNAGIYTIPCSSCNQLYIGETNNFHTRRYQHSHDLKIDSQNSALTAHRRNLNHHINLNSASLIKPIHNTENRKIIESFLIKNTHNYNIHKGDINIDNVQNLYLKKSKTFKNATKLIPPTNITDT